MASQCNLNLEATARETLDTNVPAANAARVTHDQFNLSVTLNADSTPVVSEVAYIEQALTAGAYTIDLTALQGVNETIDGTGAKVQLVEFINPAGNGDMTFSAGASNGYNLGADASWQVTVPAGGRVVLYFPEGNPDIAAGAKTIDVAGTLVEEFQAVIWIG